MNTRSFSFERVHGATTLRLACGGVSALVGHGLVFAMSTRLPAPRADLEITVTEVSLATVAEPAASAPPAPAPPAPAPIAASPAAAPRPTRVARLSQPTAQPEAAPAAAGNLITAEPGAQTSEEPVSFAVDPNGAGYGFGVVVRGGVAAAAPGPLGPGLGPTKVGGAGPRFRTDFAEPPRLLADDPCRGHFPSDADADQGDVVLTLEITAAGVVQRLTVAREEPAGQGFGRAALACLRDKRFSPARAGDGEPIAARAPVALRFHR